MDTAIFSVREIAERVGVTEKQTYNYIDKLGIKGKQKSKLRGTPKYFTEKQAAEIELGIALKEREKLSYDNIRLLLNVIREHGYREQIFLVAVDDGDTNTEGVFTVEGLDKVWKALEIKPLQPVNIKINPLPLEKYKELVKA